jgi:hypothetical protein
MMMTAFNALAMAVVSTCWFCSSISMWTIPLPVASTNTTTSLLAASRCALTSPCPVAVIFVANVKVWLGSRQIDLVGNRS